MIKKFSPINVYVALAIILSTYGCEQLDGIFTGKELAAGSTFVGADGVSVEASSNSLKDPVKVSIEQHAESLEKLGPLPDPLVQVGQAYEIEVDEAKFAEQGGFFQVGMDKPAGIPIEELVVVAWMHPDFNFGVANEDGEIVDAAPDWGELSDEGFWEVVPLRDLGDRVEMTLFYLPDTPMVFSLAQGEWFSGLPTREEVEENIRRQELGIPFIGVICERGEYGDCDSETVSRIREKVQEASDHYMESGFDLPRISGIDGGLAFITLKAVRDRKWNRFMRLCNYDEDGDMLPGFYNPVVGKATTCLYERAKRAPQIKINSVSTGATLTVKTGSNSFTATAASNNAHAFAKELERRANFPGATRTSSQFSWRIRTIDDRVTLKASGWKRGVLDYEVATTGTVDYDIIEHELWTDLTSIHEYFHAVQHGSDPLTFLRPLFLEGTAMAAQESRDRMERDISYGFRDVGIPLFQGNVKMNTHDYRGQDLYVYFGRRMNRGIEWVTELLWNKRWSGIVNALEDAGLNARLTFWGYLRNQFFEAHEPLSENHRECKAQAHGHADSHQHKFVQVDAQAMADDEVLFEREYIAPLSAYVYEIEFLPQPEETAWFVEGEVVETTGRTAIYEDGKGDCQGGHGDSNLNESSHYFVVPASQSHTVWVLAGNTVTDEALSEIQIQQVSLGVEITSPQTGAIVQENRTVHASARYNVQNQPAKILWYLDDVEFGQSNITDRSGTARIDFPACPTGRAELKAVITDDNDISVTHTVDIDIDQTGPTVGIATPPDRGFRNGSTHWIPITGGDVFDLELSALLGHNACEPITPEPNQWEWLVDTNTASGETYTIPGDAIYGDNGYQQVHVWLGFDGLVDTTLRIKPCGPFLVGANSCPDQSLLGFMDRFNDYNEIMQYRDAVDAHAAMAQILEDILGGEIPAPFPMPFPDIFAHFDEPDQPYLAINQMHQAFNADNLEDFRNQFDQGLGMAFSEDLRLPEFLANLALVVDATLDYLLPANEGGQGGFFGLSSLTERFKYPSNTEILRVAQKAFEVTLSTWIHLSVEDTQLDDADLMETSLEAGVVGGSMAAIDLIDDP